MLLDNSAKVAKNSEFLGEYKSDSKISNKVYF
jgi:hypothetical protein